MSPQEKLEDFIRTLQTADRSLVKIFLLLPETAENEFGPFRNLPIADILPSPIDLSLFKQKLQFWSTPEGKKVSPAHLFRRATKQRILLGKDVILDQINEIQGEFVNPRRLKRGKVVWLHAADLGQGRESRLAGRIIDVEPEGEAYRISLRWIGITGAQLKSFRRLIKEQRGRSQRGVRPAKARLPSNATKARIGSSGVAQNSPFGHQEELDSHRDPQFFNLVVIDPDPMSAKLASSSLEEIANLKLQNYSSLSRFLRRYPPPKPIVAEPPLTDPPSSRKAGSSELTPTSNEPHATAAPMDPNDVKNSSTAIDSSASEAEVNSVEAPRRALWTGSLQGRLRVSDEALLELKSNDTEMIGGQSLDQWIGDAKLWDVIFSRDDLDEWREQLRWLGAQKAVQTLDFGLPLPPEFEADFDRPVGAQWRVHLQIEKGEREASAIFEISWSHPDPASASEQIDGTDSSTPSEQSRPSNAKPPSVVDAIAIDIDLLGTDSASRVLKLRTLHVELENRQILNSFGRLPPFIVLVDEKMDVGFEDFESLFEERTSNPSDGRPTLQVFFHRKIHDRHLIAQLFLDVAPDAFHHPAATRERLTPINMATTLTQAYPTVSVAEYGVEIEMPFALQRGSGLWMFSEALEFGDLGVWVKCVSSSRQSDGSWINEFLFFGFVERIQQKLRARILKEYAQEKASQSS